MARTGLTIAVAVAAVCGAAGQPAISAGAGNSIQLSGNSFKFQVRRCYCIQEPLPSCNEKMSPKQIEERGRWGERGTIADAKRGVWWIDLRSLPSLLHFHYLAHPLISLEGRGLLYQ